MIPLVIGGGHAQVEKFADFYEENAKTLKTSEVLVPRNQAGESVPVVIRSLKVWFPNDVRSKLVVSEEEEKNNNLKSIFAPIDSVPKLTDNIVMRVNLFTHAGGEYVSLLQQPVIVDANVPALKNNDYSAYLKSDIRVAPGAVVVLQREYLHMGEFDFPSLVSLSWA